MIPIVAEQNILILVEGKKYNLMLSSGKKFRAWRDKKKYSNSRVVRKKNSERNKKPYIFCYFRDVYYVIDTDVLFRGEIGPSYSYVEIFISGFIQTKTKNKKQSMKCALHCALSYKNDGISK